MEDRDFSSDPSSKAWTPLPFVRPLSWALCMMRLTAEGLSSPAWLHSHQERRERCRVNTPELAPSSVFRSFGTPAGRGCVTCVRLLPPSVLTLSLHLHGPLPGPSRSSLHLPSSPHSLPDALHPACSVPLNYEESQATRGSPWFRGNAAFFFLICSRRNFFWFHHREILQTACPWGVCSLNSFPF